MLIAIGLTTVVIVGVPVLMYAIDTINTTSQLQEVQYAASQMHNATRDVDTGVSNSTSITVWIHPGVTLTAVGHTLTVSYSDNGATPRAWPSTYNHDITIDQLFQSHNDSTLYTMEVVLVDNVIHISFFAVPI